MLVLVATHAFYPAVVTSAVKVSVSGLVVALLLRQAPFPGTAQLLSTCVSISMCVLGWLLGHTMLDIVFSERLRLMAQAEAPFDALVSYGLSSSDGLVQVRSLACQPQPALCPNPLQRAFLQPAPHAAAIPQRT